MIFKFIKETKPEGDSAFTTTFLQSYRAFTTNAVVISKLIGTYNDEDRTRTLKTNVLYALERFMQEAFKDFDYKAIKSLSEFIEKLKQENYEANKEIITVFETKDKERRHRISELLVPQITFLIPREAVSPSLLVQKIDPLAVARQMTLVDQEMFSHIQRSEFLVLANESDQYNPQKYNVMKFNYRSTQVKEWVISSILLYFSIENRVKAAIHFIQIADELFKMKNFHSLNGIVNAFDVGGLLASLKICVKMT